MYTPLWYALAASKVNPNGAGFENAVLQLLLQPMYTPINKISSALAHSLMIQSTSY